MTNRILMTNRVLAGTNALTIVAVVFLAFQLAGKPSAKGAKSEADASGMTPDQPACTTTCYPFAADTFAGINGLLAKELVYNYRVSQWTSYQSHATANFVDSRSAWFSVDRLKLFLHEIEASACRPCADKMTLGVRIYFGTYPDASKWGTYHLTNEVTTDYANQHTLVMVPTYYDAKNKIDVDFDPLHWDKSTCRPDSMSRIFDTTVYPNPGIGFLVPTSLANHGNSWPTVYDQRFSTTPGTLIEQGATFATVVDSVRQP